MQAKTHIFLMKKKALFKIFTDFQFSNCLLHYATKKKRKPNITFMLYTHFKIFNFQHVGSKSHFFQCLPSRPMSLTRKTFQGFSEPMEQNWCNLNRKEIRNPKEKTRLLSSDHNHRHARKEIKRLLGKTRPQVVSNFGKRQENGQVT